MGSGSIPGVTRCVPDGRFTDRLVRLLVSERGCVQRERGPVPDLPSFARMMLSMRRSGSRQASFPGALRDVAGVGHSDK